MTFALTYGRRVDWLRNVRFVEMPVLREQPAG